MHKPRRCTRWEVHKNAELILDTSGVMQKFSCALADLSFAGAQVSLLERLPEDSLLKLNISIPPELDFSVEAWVSWHKYIKDFNAYGLYFSKLKDVDKEKISAFVRRHSIGQIRKQWWEGLTEEKGGANMDDRRIFARFAAKFPLLFINLKENKESVGHTEDVSAKGIGFLVDENIKVHTPLEMWMHVPDKMDPLYARGEVVWSKMVQPNLYRIGVNLEKADLVGMSRVMRVAKE